MRMMDRADDARDGWHEKKDKIKEEGQEDECPEETLYDLKALVKKVK